MDGACVGVQSGGNVEGEDGRAGIVGPMHERRIVVGQGPRESDAEQAVDDEGGPLVRGTGHGHPARGDEGGVRRTGVRREPGRVAGEDHGDVEIPRPKPAGHDQGIAAVVAWARQDEDTASAVARQSPGRRRPRRVPRFP